MKPLFSPNSRARLPTFRTNCPDGSHFAQMGSHFAQNTTTNPTPFGDMYVHKTPSTPPQTTPLPGLNLKVGKKNYRLGKMGPNWAKCLNCGQNFSRSGQKNFIHGPHQSPSQHGGWPTACCPSAGDAAHLRGCDALSSRDAVSLRIPQPSPAQLVVQCCSR